MVTEQERERLAAATTRLEAVLPPTGMARTRALLDRARDLTTGLPIGMSTDGLIELMTRDTAELEAGQ